MSLMSAFRRSVSLHTARKNGKGGKGNWRERMKFEKDVATPITLINAEYLDPNPPPALVEIDPATGRPKPVKTAYRRTPNHRVKLSQSDFRDEPCSAGIDPYHPQPCVGCSAMDRGDKRVTLSDKFAMGIIHLVPYHEHPTPDEKTGGWVTKHDGSPWMSSSACELRSCNFCRILAGQPPIVAQGEFWPQYNPRDIKTIFGGKRYLELGSGHLGDLEGWDMVVGSTCTALRPFPDGSTRPCGQQLATMSFNCPSCDSVIIDATSFPGSDEELAKVAAQSQPCMRCAKSVVTVEKIICDTNQGGCGNIKQNSIFDVVLHGMRQGEGTNSHLTLQRFETWPDFSYRVQQQYANLLGGKSLKDRIETLSKPYDFDEMFKPRDLAAQSKRLMLDVPNVTPQQPQQFMNAPPIQQPGGYTQPQGQPPPPPPQQQYGAPPAPLPSYPQQYQSYPPAPNTYPQQPQQQQGPPPYQPNTRPNFGG